MNRILELEQMVSLKELRHGAQVRSMGRGQGQGQGQGNDGHTRSEGGVGLGARAKARATMGIPEARNSSVL